MLTLNVKIVLHFLVYTLCFGFGIT